MQHAVSENLSLRTTDANETTVALLTETPKIANSNFKSPKKGTLLRTMFSLIPVNPGRYRMHKEGRDVQFHQLTVSVKGQTILKEVSGLAQHGSVLAIMGPSGRSGDL